MKKMGFLAVMVVLMSGCNNSAEISSKVDSLGKQLDTLAKNAWDSTKKGVKNLKEKIDVKLDGKDSSGKNK